MYPCSLFHSQYLVCAFWYPPPLAHLPLPSITFKRPPFLTASVSLVPFWQGWGGTQAQHDFIFWGTGIPTQWKEVTSFLSVNGNFNFASRIPRVRVLEDEEGSKDIELSDDPYDCIQLSVENVPCIVTLCKVRAFISWFFLPCQSPPTLAC